MHETEVIEIIYDEKPVSNNECEVRLPKNIRQIGEPDILKKVYIEDYVAAYISRISQRDIYYQKTAVLMGEVKKKGVVTYIFIKGAFELELEGDRIEFSEEMWNRAYEVMKKYFGRWEIVGWFASTGGAPVNITDDVERTHINNFAGTDKVLFMVDPVEKEDAFFSYSNGNLNRHRGYIIYYEKNETMQQYIVETNKEETEKSEDVVVENYRNIIKERKEEAKKKKIASTLASIGSFAALILIVVAITIVNNNKAIETSVSGTENSASEAVIVNNIEGNVETTAPSPESEALSVAESDSVTSESAVVVSEEAAATGTKNYYVVKAGETLLEISEEVYNSRDMVESIKKLNNIEDADKIYEGQVIVLP